MPIDIKDIPIQMNYRYGMTIDMVKAYCGGTVEQTPYVRTAVRPKVNTITGISEKGYVQLIPGATITIHPRYKDGVRSYSEKGELDLLIICSCNTPKVRTIDSPARFKQYNSRTAKNQNNLVIQRSAFGPHADFKVTVIQDINEKYSNVMSITEFTQFMIDRAKTFGKNISNKIKLSLPSIGNYVLNTYGEAEYNALSLSPAMLDECVFAKGLGNTVYTEIPDPDQDVIKYIMEYMLDANDNRLDRDTVFIAPSNGPTRYVSYRIESNGLMSVTPFNEGDVTTSTAPRQTTPEQIPTKETRSAEFEKDYVEYGYNTAETEGAVAGYVGCMNAYKVMVGTNAALEVILHLLYRNVFAKKDWVNFVALAGDPNIDEKKYYEVVQQKNISYGTLCLIRKALHTCGYIAMDRHGEFRMTAGHIAVLDKFVSETLSAISPEGINFSDPTIGWYIEQKGHSALEMLQDSDDNRTMAFISKMCESLSSPNEHNDVSFVVIHELLHHARMYTDFILDKFLYKVRKHINDTPHNGVSVERQVDDIIDGLVEDKFAVRYMVGGRTYVRFTSLVDMRVATDVYFKLKAYALEFRVNKLYASYIESDQDKLPVTTEQHVETTRVEVKPQSLSSLYDEIAESLVGRTRKYAQEHSQLMVRPSMDRSVDITGIFNTGVSDIDAYKEGYAHQSVAYSVDVTFASSDKNTRLFMFITSDPTRNITAPNEPNVFVVKVVLNPKTRPDVMFSLKAMNTSFDVSTVIGDVSMNTYEVRSYFNTWEEVLDLFFGKIVDRCHNINIQSNFPHAPLSAVTFPPHLKERFHDMIMEKHVSQKIVEKF